MVDLDKKVVVTRNMIRIKEKGWVLKVDRVQTKTDEIMYVLTPLEQKVDEENKHEYHVKMKEGIFLSGLEMEEFINGCIKLSSDYNGKVSNISNEQKME